MTLAGFRYLHSFLRKAFLDLSPPVTFCLRSLGESASQTDTAFTDVLDGLTIQKDVEDGLMLIIVDRM